jgi:hypothetical protein
VLVKLFISICGIAISTNSLIVMLEYLLNNGKVLTVLGETPMAFLTSACLFIVGICLFFVGMSNIKRG